MYTFEVKTLNNNITMEQMIHDTNMKKYCTNHKELYEFEEEDPAQVSTAKGRKNKSKTENDRMLGSMWSKAHTDGNNSNNMTHINTSPYRKGRNGHKEENRKAVQTKMTKYTNNGPNERNHIQHKNTILKNDHWASKQKLDLDWQKLSKQTSERFYWPPYDDSTSNQNPTTTNNEGGLRGSIRGNIDTGYRGSKVMNVAYNHGGYYNENHRQGCKGITGGNEEHRGSNRGNTTDGNRGHARGQAYNGYGRDARGDAERSIIDGGSIRGQEQHEHGALIRGRDHRDHGGTVRGNDGREDYISNTTTNSKEKSYEREDNSFNKDSKANWSDKYHISLPADYNTKIPTHRRIKCFASP
jgi:hypothetical protein